MGIVLPQSFRDERWAAFLRELERWLDTPEGRFAAFCAERDRREQTRAVAAGAQR